MVPSSDPADAWVGPLAIGHSVSQPDGPDRSQSKQQKSGYKRKQVQQMIAAEGWKKQKRFEHVFKRLQYTL